MLAGEEIGKDTLARSFAIAPAVVVLQHELRVGSEEEMVNVR
jgi:hypothetical protein